MKTSSTPPRINNPSCISARLAQTHRAGWTACAAFALLALISGQPAAAGTYDWNDTGTDFGTAGNWSPGNSTFTTTDLFRFNNASYVNSPTVASNQGIGELQFTANNAAGITFGAGTNTLTLSGIGGIGIQLDSGSGAVDTGGAKFAIGGNQTWLNNSALTVNGTITNSGNSTAYNFKVDGTGNTSLNGIISNGGTLGTLSLTKNGTGTLTLSSANTYTGATAINAGTIKVGNSSALGNATSTVTISNNATLQAGGTGLTLANQLAVGTGGAVVDTQGNTLTLSGNNSTVFVSGTASFSKIGSGTLIVSSNTVNTSTYSGPLFVKQGTLRYGAGAVNTNTLLGTGTINLGDATLQQNATYEFNLGANNRNLANPFNVVNAGAGNLTISATGTNGNTFGFATTGAITLNHDLVLQNSSTSGGGTSNAGAPYNGAFVDWAITGNTTGTGNLTLASTGASQSASIWIAGTVNSVGTITNTGTNAAANNVISGVIGTNVQGVIQNSATDLTLSGNNTYTRPTTILSGNLNAGSLNKVSGGTASSNLGAPTTSANGTIAIGSTTNAGQLTYIGTGETTDRIIDLAGTTGNVTLDQSGTGLVKFSSPLTASGVGAKTLILQGSTAGSGEIAGAIVDSASGATALTKAGTGIWTVSGANTNTGNTTVSAGVLTFGKQQALYNSANASWTPTKVTVASGAALALGVGDSASGYFDAAAIDTFRNGTHMGLSTATTGFKSSSIFGIDTTNATGGNFTYGSAISNMSNSSLTNGFAKLGTGTLTLSGLSATAANNYTGTTIIDKGTLAITTTNPVLTGGLTFGAAQLSTNLGSLDLTGASATFNGSMTVQNTMTLATANTITIGNGQTLTVNGGLNMGVGSNPVTAGSITNLSASGAGSMVFNKAGGTFQVGGQQGGTNVGDNGTVLDASALAGLSVDMGSAGIVRVGGGGSGSTGNPETLRLGTTSTLKAGTIGIADSTTSAGGLMSIYLGNGTQTIQANAINIGTGARPNAQLLFGGATGTVTISGYAGGASTANLTIGQSASTTGGTTTQTFDVSGHTATIALANLTMAARNVASTGQLESDIFKFDTGTLTFANQAILANNTGTTVNTSNTANMTLGGGSLGTGSVTFTNGLILAQNISTGTPASGTPTANATLTINANTGFAFGVTSGTITMASTNGTTSANNRAAATLNLNGGTLTMTGDIVQGATGNGTASSTVNLNGGTLAMASHNIGGATALTFNAKSGALSNVGQINNGVGFTKTTAGTLILSGTNTYTGNTTVSAGTLLLDGGGSLAAGSPVWVNAGKFGGNGTVNGDVTFSGTAILQAGASLSDTAMLTLNGNVTTTVGSILSLGLGSASTHDVLAFNPAATVSLQPNQSFTFLDQGAVPGTTYLSIVTGLSPSLDVSSWTANAPWNGSFSNNAGNIDFLLTAIPEPTTWLLVGIGLTFLLYRKPRRHTER